MVYLWFRGSSVSHGAGQEREYKKETGSSDWICRYVNVQLIHVANSFLHKISAIQCTHTHTHTHNHCNNQLCLFLDSLKGDKLKNVEEHDSMIVDCLVKLGRLDEAAKKLHTMILAHPDHWLYIKTYVRCQVQRCQNFKERVRQQVERHRRSRQQQEKQESTENGTGSSEDSTNGDVERSRNGEAGKEEESRDSGSAEAAGGEEKRDGVNLSDGQGQGEEEEEKGRGKGDNERGMGEKGEGEETGDEEEEETAAGAKEITVR